MTERYQIYRLTLKINKERIEFGLEIPTDKNAFQSNGYMNTLSLPFFQGNLLTIYRICIVPKGQFLKDRVCLFFRINYEFVVEKGFGSINKGISLT
jgi:hypothetical protein